MTKHIAPGDPDILHGLDEIAAACGCCPRTARKLVAAGVIPTVKLGGQHTITRRRLLQAIDGAAEGVAFAIPADGEPDRFHVVVGRITSTAPMTMAEADRICAEVAR